jgi:hypothetical protein
MSTLTYNDHNNNNKNPKSHIVADFSLSGRACISSPESPERK